MERVLEAETDACVGLSRPGNGQGCSAGGRKLTRPFQWQREDRRPGRWPMSPGWEVPVPVAASRPRRRGTSRSFILRVLEARSQNQGVSRTMLPLSLPPPPEKTLEESCLFQVSGLPVSLELPWPLAALLWSRPLHSLGALPVCLSRRPLLLGRTVVLRFRAHSYPV